uniref:Uncharacterized protein n=1 Tax=Glossina pallidipes TaxID=7398 RepID=A0A1A9ZVI1_GLOPL
MTSDRSRIRKVETIRANPTIEHHQQKGKVFANASSRPHYTDNNDLDNNYSSNNDADDDNDTDDDDDDDNDGSSGSRPPRLQSQRPVDGPTVSIFRFKLKSFKKFYLFFTTLIATLLVIAYTSNA